MSAAAVGGGCVVDSQPAAVVAAVVAVGGGCAADSQPAVAEPSVPEAVVPADAAAVPQQTGPVGTSCKADTVVAPSSGKSADVTDFSVSALKALGVTPACVRGKTRRGKKRKRAPVPVVSADTDSKPDDIVPADEPQAPTAVVPEQEAPASELLKTTPLAYVQSVTDKPFTLAVTSSSQAQLPTQRSCTVEQFLQTDLQNEMVWLDTGLENPFEAIKHYTECKEKAPHSIGACIVVPDTTGAHTHLLKGMQQIITFPKKSYLYENVQADLANIAVAVYYDPPHHHKLTLAAATAAEVGSHLTMTFSGIANKANANIALDSQSSTNFVSASWLKRHRVSFKQREAMEVHLADGTVARTFGELSLTLKIGKWRESVKCWVMELKGFDIILGDAWMKHHKALLDYGTKSVMIYRGKRRYTLTARTRAKSLGPEQKLDGMLLSAMQAKKVFKVEHKTHNKNRIRLVQVKL